MYFGEVPVMADVEFVCDTLQLQLSVTGMVTIYSHPIGQTCHSTRWHGRLALPTQLYLDLFVTYDTVDHAILLQHLNESA